jgi:hypothetical protein
MESRNTITTVTLRATVSQAHRSGIDLAEVLAPLIADAIA